MAQLLHGLPLRMKHMITTPSRFNPYPFQLRCSQSPSPLKSPIVLDVTQKSTPSVSPTEHRPQQPLLDLTNSLYDQGSTSSDNSMLDTLSANKKENPLPPINKAALLKPEDVVEKYIFKVFKHFKNSNIGCSTSKGKLFWQAYNGSLHC